MIGHIIGKLVMRRPPQLIVDVNGVGYELEAPMSTFYDLPETDQSVHLHTHLVVRDDAHLLYGFSRLGDRDMFRNLLRVTGVGPRMGLAILSGLSREELVACIRGEDLARLTRVPGVGRKTAERLIIDMRDRLTDDDTVDDEGSLAVASGGPQAQQDALHALEVLGYKPKEAERAIASVKRTGLSTEDLIREALRGLAG